MRLRMDKKPIRDYNFPPNYHTVQTLNKDLDKLCNKYPDLVAKYKLGETIDKEEILGCIVSSCKKEEQELKNKPASLIIGCHHGRECIASEAVYYTMNLLLKNYSSNDQFRTWIDQSVIIFIPLLNPHGHDIIERKNENNVDINRNYTFNWGNENGASHDPLSETYCGPSPLSEIESQLANQMKIIDDLFLKYKNIKSSLDIHSGTEVILHPWGWTYDKCADYDLFQKLCKQMETKAKEMQVQPFEYSPAVNLYPTSGTFTDHVYQFYHNISFVNEIYYGKWSNNIFEFFNPPSDKVETVCKRTLPPIYVVIDYAAQS
jgi:hypothetical protein